MFTVTLQKLEVNVPLQDERFRIPTQLDQGS